LAKITRTQRRLVASSVAFVLSVAIMMPTTTDARGHGGGGFHVGIRGFSHLHPLTSTPGFAVLHGLPARHVFSNRPLAFRNAHAIRSHFFTFGPDSFWVDSFVSSPTLVVTPEPAIAQEAAAPRHRAVVRMPDAQQDGIVVVRGNSKAYVTFAGKAG
jgi:hypothetical protein